MKVGITQGDTNGVGLEVIIKALAPEGITEMFTPVIFANKQLTLSTMQALKGQVNFRFVPVDSASDAKPGRINLVNVGSQAVVAQYGAPSEESGRAAYDALEMAVEALKEGDIDVLVTAPISKSAIQSADFRFAGHTEYLQNRLGGIVERVDVEELTDAEHTVDAATGEETESTVTTVDEHIRIEKEDKAQMILFADKLRVCLLTTHLPLADVTPMVTKDNIVDATTRFDDALKRNFDCDRPLIAVLSLNPHCGDDGVLGTTEKDEIITAIKELQENGVLAFGPYAADGFFGSGEWTKFDGVLAMYHDQGLAPFKALMGSNGVNFTAGLPFVRTSPDHGTAYDIAGKMTADPTSMREAIYRAIDIYNARERYEEMTENPLK